MKTDSSLKQLTPEATISQIISADKPAGELLASIGLSIPKHEHETLRSVCQQQKWSGKEVLKWIKRRAKFTNGKIESDESQELSTLTEFTVYLETQFISPNQTLLEELDQSIPRVHKVHGNQYTWLKNMQGYYHKFKEALDRYYQFEQETFFPLAGRLSGSKNGRINHGDIQKLEKAFRVIERDQEQLQQHMISIREKGNNFENPGNACSTLRIQNRNFTLLFSRLEVQFTKETDWLIPHLQQQLTARH